MDLYLVIQVIVWRSQPLIFTLCGAGLNRLHPSRQWL